MADLRLSAVPPTGSIRVAGGAPTPTRLAIERVTDKGRLVTVVAGALRVGLLRFLVLVTLGKGARYLFIGGAYLWWRGSGA